MKRIVGFDNVWIGLPRYLQSTGTQPDLPPIAIHDARSFSRTDAPFTIDVLANDIDPENGVLTLVSAVASRGSVATTPENTLIYSPPETSIMSDTVQYVIEDAEGNQANGLLAVTITDTELSIEVTPNNTLIVHADAAPTEINITEPAAFAGAYQTDISQILLGPVPLFTPHISGVPEVGQTLTCSKTIWISDANNSEPSISYQWLRNGTAISGAQTSTFTLTGADTGHSISVQETSSDEYGTQNATTSGIDIADSGSGTFPTFLAGDSTGGGNLESSKTLTLDFLHHNDIDDIVIMIGVFGGTLGSVVNSVTLDGDAATYIESTTVTSSSGLGTMTAVAVFSGRNFETISSLTIQASSAFYDVGAAAYVVPSGAQIGILNAHGESNRSVSEVSGNVTTGDTIIAANIVANGTLPSWSGVDEDYATDVRSNEWFSSASSANLMEESPRTVTATGSNVATAAMSIVVS